MTLFLNNKQRLLCTKIVFILFIACNNPPVSSDYGEAYNHVRDSLGLKRLSADWTISKFNEYFNYSGYPIHALVLMYDNPEIDSTLNEFKLYYVGKTLGIKNDTLKYESDHYAIMRFPSPTNAVIKKSLSYKYEYYPDNYNFPMMSYQYLINPHPEQDSSRGHPYTEWIDAGTRHDSEGQPIPMTRVEADSILATWGMKYP